MTDSRLKVLYIEDSPEDVFMVKSTLKDRTYGQFTVEHAEGLADIPEAGAGIDAILIDLIVPGMDTEAAVQVLRRRFPGAPIIAFSGGASPRRTIEAMRMGVDSVEDKSARERLPGALRQAIERSRLTGARLSDSVNQLSEIVKAYGG